MERDRHPKIPNCPVCNTKLILTRLETSQTERVWVWLECSNHIQKPMDGVTNEVMLANFLSEHPDV